MAETTERLDLAELRRVVESARGALKVFPLPGAVLLPGTPAPFHIFEPRYRAMTADALAGDRLLAIATLVSEEGASQDRPPVHPIAGAGYIEVAQARPDGRYDLYLQGVVRVRLLAELDNGKPYREFRAEIVEDVYPAGGPAAVSRERAALQACVRQLADLLPAESGAPRLAVAAMQARDPSALADLVAAAVVSEPVQRLAVVEQVDVKRRLELVTAEVASVLLMLSRGKSPTA